MIARKQQLHEPPLPCINDLPNCLLVEIVLRLPLIKAHQLKLVCKRWYSVFSQPYFADRFSQDEKLSSLLFDYCNDRDMHIYSCDSYSYHLNKELSLDFINSGVLIEACSNDLLLCRAVHTTPCWDEYLVCNPVTREQVRFPTFPILLPSNQRAYRSCTRFASKKSGEFAVIRIIYARDDLCRSILWAFSSNTHQWATPSLPMTRVRGPWLSASNYAGVLDKVQSFWYESFYDIIVGFDPYNVCAKSSWLFIDPPKGLVPRSNLSYSCSNLGVCRKNLRFCQISRETGKDDFVLRVWDLKGHAEWILYGQVSLQNVARKYGFGEEEPTYVKDCHPNDPDIIYLPSYSKNYVTSLSFDISTCEMKKVHESCSLYGVVPYTLQWRPTPLPFLEE